MVNSYPVFKDQGHLLSCFLNRCLLILPKQFRECKRKMGKKLKKITKPNIALYKPNFYNTSRQLILFEYRFLRLLYELPISVNAYVILRYYQIHQSVPFR